MMILNEAIQRFERGLIGQGASKNTVESYRRHLKLLVKFFPEKHVEEVGPTDLNEFLFSVRLKADGTEKTPRTMNAIKTAVNPNYSSAIFLVDGHLTNVKRSSRRGHLPVPPPFPQQRLAPGGA